MTAAEHADPREVVALDLDGTITRRDTLLPFLARVTGTPGVLKALAGATLRAASPRGASRRDGAKETVVGRVLGGRNVQEIEAVAEQYADDVLRSRMRTGALDLMSWHAAQGRRLVIVSASPELYVAPLARRLGAQALATRLEVDADGRFTGRFLGRNCRGAEKATRLRAWLGSESVRIWAYGDSDGDVELLAMANVPLRVQTRRWPRRLDDLTSLLPPDSRHRP